MHSNTTHDYSRYYRPSFTLPFIASYLHPQTWLPARDEDDERWKRKRNKGRPLPVMHRTVALASILLLSGILFFWAQGWGSTPCGKEVKALRDRRDELAMWRRLWTENEKTKRRELEGETDETPTTEKVGGWKWFSNNNNNNAKKDTIPGKRSDVTAVRTRRRKKPATLPTTKYLIFMPWEQLNNQLIEFRCACATAQLLNRTLVLPKLGHRRDPSDWNFSYDVKGYLWKDFENYFRIDDQVTDALPCDFVTIEDFRKVVKSWGKVSAGGGLGDLRFNPVAAATNREQLKEYYGDVLHLPYTQIIDGPREYQLSKSQILSKYAPDTSRVLALGSLFWFYDFESPQEYPLKSYADLTQHSIYSSIVKGTLVQWDIEMVAEIVARALDGADGFDAMHVRRGDYWKKCSGISNLELRAKCYPSNSDLVTKAEEAERIGSLQEKKTGRQDPLPPYRRPSSTDPHTRDKYVSPPKLASSLPPSTKRRHLYVSTNIPGRDPSGLVLPDFSELESPGRRIYFASDILEQPYVPLDREAELVRLAKAAWRKFDPVQKALVDLRVCVKARMFVGNFYSSFSRTVFEMRSVEGKEFLTY